MIGPNDRVFPGNFSHGIDVRTYLAAMAMQGLLAGENEPYVEAYMATSAVNIADALIAELNKEKPHP